MNTCICPAHVRILNVGWLAHKKRDAAHDAAAALTRGPMSWPAGTWQPGRDMSDDGHSAMPRRGGGWRTELSHYGWGRLRNRGFDAEQRPRGWHGEESRGAAAGTLRHGESSFGEEQTWYDELALGADFADAQHQPSFNVAAQDGDSPSPRQAARVKQLLEQAEAEAEAHGRSAVLGADGDTGSPQHARRRAGPRVSRTASTGPVLGSTCVFAVAAVVLRRAAVVRDRGSGGVASAALCLVRVPITGCGGAAHADRADSVSLSLFLLPLPFPFPSRCPLPICRRCRRPRPLPATLLCPRPPAALFALLRPRLVAVRRARAPRGSASAPAAERGDGQALRGAGERGVEPLEAARRARRPRAGGREWVGQRTRGGREGGRGARDRRGGVTGEEEG